jgi:hypothetical protein
LRVLVAGWFSLREGGATAGDVMARDVACAWLAERDIPFDVALEPALGDGVDWFRVAPARYSDLLFVCGPVGPDLQVAELIDRFSGCRRTALNVSLVGGPDWQPFDVVIERDGAGEGRPDLALDAPAHRVPVVARVEIHRQAEYAGARPEAAHAAFDRLLGRREAAVLLVDTRLDPAVPGRRTAAEVEALIAAADVVLTTRLHGLVLALRAGLPALAVDPVPGGAKVLAQARALSWPAALSVDLLDDELLERHLEWCMEPAARDAARAAAGHGLAEVRSALDARFPVP